MAARKSPAKAKPEHRTVEVTEAPEAEPTVAPPTVAPPPILPVQRNPVVGDSVLYLSPPFETTQAAIITVVYNTLEVALAVFYETSLVFIQGVPYGHNQMGCWSWEN